MGRGTKVATENDLESKKRLAAQIFAQLPTERQEALAVLEMAKKWIEWDGGALAPVTVLRPTG